MNEAVFWVLHNCIVGRIECECDGAVFPGYEFVCVPLCLLLGACVTHTQTHHPILICSPVSLKLHAIHFPANIGCTFYEETVKSADLPGARLVLAVNGSTLILCVYPSLSIVVVLSHTHTITQTHTLSFQTLCNLIVVCGY